MYIVCPLPDKSLDAAHNLMSSNGPFSSRRTYVSHTFYDKANFREGPGGFVYVCKSPVLLGVNIHLPGSNIVESIIRPFQNERGARFFSLPEDPEIVASLEQNGAEFTVADRSLLLTSDVMNSFHLSLRTGVQEDKLRDPSLLIFEQNNRPSFEVLLWMTPEGEVRDTNRLSEKEIDYLNYRYDLYIQGLREEQIRQGFLNR